MKRHTLRAAASTLLVVGYLLTPRAVTAETVQVTVDVTRAYAICGHEQVQRNVFGVTAYEGATLPAEEQGRRILQQAGITCLGFPGVIGWCAPTEQPSDRRAGIERWYGSPEAERLIRDLPLNGDRYMYGRILPACREIGIEPMVYLLGGPQWMLGPEAIPLDDDLYADLLTQYVGLLRRSDPKLRLFHLDNEPNTHWFKVNKAGAEYGRLFARVAASLKSRYPDALIGGPVLCWPPAWPPSQEGQPNWYTWDTWTLPFLDAAGDRCDFFDFHLYPNGEIIVPVALEEITLIANEMWRRRRARVPIVISECGIGLSEAEWKDEAAHWFKRTLPWARFLLAMLDQPDKVMSVQMHDLSAVAGEWFRLVKGTDLQDQTPTYWLYWLLRHVRGTRLVATAQGGQSLTVFATRGSDPSIGRTAEAAVMMFNDSDAPQEARVRFIGADATPVRWERLFLDTQTRKVVRESGRGQRIRLPARSLAAAWVSVPPGLPLKRAREREEYFGRSVMNEFAAVGTEAAIPVTVPAEVLRGAREARVRVGTLGSAPGDRVTLLVGNDSYPLRGGTYFQEIRLRHLPPPGNSVLRFRLDKRDGEHRLRVSCATIVIERELTAKPAKH